MFPRCGVPDAYDGWDGFERYVRFLYDTGSIEEHTQIWWSVRPHLAFPTIEIRISDGQPDLAEARSLAAVSYALAVRIAQALDEGEPLPEHPNRLIEENLWRAIRYGLSGELIDLQSGDVRPARARPRAAARVGPARGRAESAPLPTWRSLRPTPPSGRSPATPRARRSRRSTPSRSDPRSALAEDEQKLVEAAAGRARKLKVTDLLLQTLYTVSSLGYHRLEGETKRPEPGAARDRGAARRSSPCSRARSRRKSLRDFRQVLANLQLAYASVASESE